METDLIKNQLDELVRVQAEILVSCDLLTKNLRYLTQDHENKISEVIQGDKFFVLAGNCMWDILITELYKLFHEKEAYSLNRTVSILTSNRGKLVWNSRGDFSQIETLVSEIESEEIQGIVAKLKYVRDKRIAHLDRDRFDEEILVHLDEVQILLTKGQSLVSETNIGLNGIQLGLDHQVIGLCESTIMNLAAYNELRR